MFLFLLGEMWTRSLESNGFMNESWKHLQHNRVKSNNNHQHHYLEPQTTLFINGCLVKQQFSIFGIIQLKHPFINSCLGFQVNHHHIYTHIHGGADVFVHQWVKMYSISFRIPTHQVIFSNQHLLGKSGSQLWCKWTQPNPSMSRLSHWRNISKWTSPTYF